MTPPTVTEDYLGWFGDDNVVTLYVPAGAKANYENAEPWSEFNIVELSGGDDVAVDIVQADGLSVRTEGKTIFVEGECAGEVAVYSLSGAGVCRGECVVEVPASGTYIVRIGNFSAKVLVRRETFFLIRKTI